ncbi:hypothetical protein SAMN05445060_2159 [Williamsia sterculiae]|uniref:Probable membrane transporter protein n=1 Tax=Williamsia sterculiae TaxID=1344003 RepID=A0A1N7FL39_9NOCA|nr:hypothetical protein SAMN05445060_2159 [Williamsia sterculiae]
MERRAPRRRRSTSSTRAEPPLHTVVEAVLLVVAGYFAGLIGYVTGLASLVSYPALLAVGLPPVAANVTNTVSLVAVGIGSTAGAGKSVLHHGRRLWWWVLLSAVGGAIGAALLLNTSPDSFAAAVPALIVLACLALLAQPTLRRLAGGREFPGIYAIALLLIAVYGGYFGAGAGVVFLAATLMCTAEPLWRASILKSLMLGVANLVAAVWFALTGPVDWPAAAAMAVGCLLGGRTGPPVVAHLPERPLRIGVALAGFGLAAWLWAR